MEQPDSYLSGARVVLSDEVLDRIDEIVPPGGSLTTSSLRPSSPRGGAPS
jgi:hypothetical protein